MDTSNAPRDDLFRGVAIAPQLRAADNSETGSGVMFGHFARFNERTEIDSWFEGRFIEELAPGAFKKTMNENRDRLRVQFDHGYDTFVGSAPLGAITDLREDSEGAAYEVALLDTDYVRDRVLPLLEGRALDGTLHGSQLGASFRMRVIKDEWDRTGKKTSGNPEGLPVRTIREVGLYEFGPVVFPAYAGATASVRSLTDHFLERRAQRNGRTITPAASGTGTQQSIEPATGHSGMPLTLALATRQLLDLRKVN
jgi:HK97 family phage prohead protease